MRQIYNQTALDKISKQSQLDQMVRIVPHHIWAIVVATVLILAGLVFWAFQGKIPTSMQAQGFYMNAEGMYGQYATTDGTLLEIKAQAGDHVKAGDVLALIADDEYFNLSQLDERIAYVENITFDSDFDDITADTAELAEIKRKANMVNTDVQKMQTSLNIKKEKLANLTAQAAQRKNEMLAYKQTYFETLALDNPVSELKYNESQQDFENKRANFDSVRNNYISRKQSYYQAQKEFNAKYRHFNYDTATEEEQSQYDTDLANLQTMADESEDAQLLLEYAEDDYNTADQNLNSAREDYLIHLNEASGLQAENSIAYTEYSELLTSYNTLLSDVKSLDNEVNDLEISLITAQFDDLQNYESAGKQFENQKASVISKLQNERNNWMNEVTKGSITATHNGRIYMVDAEVGSKVLRGQKVATILPSTDEVRDNVFLIIPYTQLNKIRVEDEVHVTPMGLNPNEYGYMYGKVISINSYLETNESMMELIDNENLVNQLNSENGVFTIVNCELTPDPDSANGYRWSGKKGESYRLSRGDMLSATIITANKRPIDVFIPYVKDKLDFKKDEKDKK